MANDETTNSFKVREVITFNISMFRYDAVIDLEDAIVEIDDYNRITKMICNMTQLITSQDYNVDLVLKAEFTFSYYRKTVIDIAQ